MIQVTRNVYVETGIPVCNLGLVTTSKGIVLIDVPLLPSGAVKWRDIVKEKGNASYLITTEEHPDHCQNSWLLPGVLISSQNTRNKLLKMPVAELKERTLRADPGAASVMETFQLRPADITFTDKLDLYFGDHTFNLFSLQGHSSGGIAVYIPEERIVFTTDIVFHRFKTWMQEADPDKWLDSLRRIGELDVDTMVPGHGALCKKDYLKEQASIVQGWVDAVKAAIKKGWSVEEALTRISSPDPYPPQPGIPLNADDLNKMIVTHLYDIYSK
jgi:cyclase